MVNKMRSVISFLFLAIFLVPGHIGMFGDPSSEEDGSDRELIAELNDFRRMRDNGQFIPALKIGYEAVNNEDLFCNMNHPKQESLLFEVAAAQLEYIDKILNPVQARQCAGRSALLWKKYIDWYHVLTEGQRSAMHPSHIRINRAVAHLGNSLIRKGDLFELLDLYSNIAALNALYFGPDAFVVWKKGLYGCPDGNANKPHTAANRKASIVNGCDEHWNTYAAILKEWITMAPLQSSAKVVYAREIEQVEREIRDRGGVS